MNDTEPDIQQIEEGNAWEETDEVAELEVKHPLENVIPVRLTSDEWEELRRETRELGVGPSTLARMWIFERLRRSTLNK